MKRAAWAAVLLLIVSTSLASAQLPRVPRATGIQPMPRDSLRDSILVKWPTPDSVTAALLAKQGYTVTRYQGDTAFFNAQRHSLDLLAAQKRNAIVERDSQIVVSDSGIYYTETTRHVTTGGHYRIRPPKNSGQADIRGGPGRVDYNLAESSIRITNANLPVNNGEIWYMYVKDAKVVNDTSGGKHSPDVFAGVGTLTSCDDTIPDYHFEYREARRTSTNMIAAAPAILYIKDVPVLWLPFIFSDSRAGRHSGILAPQFGLSDIVRNSPSYRRHVDHAGYYWAINDYMDVSTWLDWRSSAGATVGDPGWTKLNADWDYKWLDRFLSGRVGVAYTSQEDGLHNFALSWSHQQDLTPNSHLTTSVNYVTNTVLQRQNTFNPYTALATIASQATYQEKIGPASLSIGATRKQYPGRTQVDQTFPTLSLTTTPIGIGSELSWTPAFSFSRSDVLAIDQPGIGAFNYTVDPVTARLDSTASTSRNSSTAALSFDTPLTIFGYKLGNSFRVNQTRNNFPVQYTIYDVNTGAVTDTRVFAATYNTSVDWTPQFTLPPFFRNRFNLSPSISLGNVDPGPFWVASERTNGEFVHQSKRITGGVSASPTIYGLFPGFGPFLRFRHTLTPTIGYSWAPASTVSDDYLTAFGRTRKGYLGNLPVSSINFGINQVFQTKVRVKGDTANADAGTPVDLLGIDFSALTYDFERAKQFQRTNGHAGLSGIATDSWTYSLRSDLLPGFDFSSTYSLFQGSTLSDTAKFSPYLTNISANFTLGQNQNPFAVFARLFGRAVPQPVPAGSTPTEGVRPGPDSTQTAVIAAQPVAGTSQSNPRYLVPPQHGWRATFALSRTSPRPPAGNSNNIITLDPQTRCEQQSGGNPLILDACLQQQRAQPTTQIPDTSVTAGGTLYNIPPTTSLNADIAFDLTPKWTTHWITTYDLEHHAFASQNVQLQRELHDWRASFGFTQSPNGNFAFSFTIALKADPDIKTDYNRTTIRSTGIPFTPF